ncbi:putative quinol monooxygenase [Pokkaliibacter sp. MBI-7]|uniref:putative quinol monooxygenase n=1 Tax=Pokkaliibacter sp. MBI-7 TaxID=3040600 RepID=UPI00244CF856|nr:putative quinol monooxygenase [Pokkaliibacter sp. MBI-7]MDH2435509.1 putative quinol monooxygenase [Pokkaliibacter sp. MBI-7]
MEALTIMAYVRAQQGQSLHLGRALIELVEPSRAEEGCQAFDVHQSLDDQDLWVIVERWRNEDDLQAHFRQPHMQHFIDRLPELVHGVFDLYHYQMMSTPAQSSGAQPDTSRSPARPSVAERLDWINVTPFRNLLGKAC